MIKILGKPQEADKATTEGRKEDLETISGRPSDPKSEVLVRQEPDVRFRVKTLRVA